ncbi:hypothetical protein BUALT_Bualt03G0032100 [Buddleja alternifolia]|uniref:Uncharacterized protein n=1 Tax=Buddleja alternifolia TaxID=168488 RepID=A0AAV6Y224_9LAMI|nr:hypothetical protein BUALT_Bualt03G0032100 [Buddleja alternifolia]
MISSVLACLVSAANLLEPPCEVGREKVCVFFSIMLHGISEVGKKSWINVVTDDFVQSLGSLTLHIRSVLSDQVLRRIFTESCDLFELFALIEDFLLRRKVLVYGDVSVESQVLCSSKVNVVLNGNAIMLSEVVASAQLLVAGGGLLASLCLAVDHIGFVCEMSCNIFGMQRFEPSVVLAVLHAFAHICGSRYFTLQQYAVPMTVVKSLVIFLEKQTMSTSSTSSSHPIVETPSKVWLCCTNCPFSEGAVSMEDVALLLLEKLQKYAQSVSWPQESLKLINSLSPRACVDRTEEVSSLREGVLSSGTSDEKLCSLLDTLSLVEILASFMSWSWTFDNIIDQICEWLESRLMEGFSAVIVVLLGQLGRLGVGASGYEDIRVDKLREWLSSHWCKSTFRKLRLPVQLAIINALFGLTPIKFEEIIKDGAEIPANISPSFPANSVREWFFQLSSEQQSLFRLNQGCW